MKRSEALSEIRHCGYIGDTSKAGIIAVQKGIGTSAAKKEYLNGEKARKNGWECDCTACKAKRGKK
jgi:hypothetical protein